MGQKKNRFMDEADNSKTVHTKEVGLELRRLRVIAGKTQDDIANHMHVQQAAVSKIEKGGEVYLSTIERYVQALGAKLRLAATFTSDAPIAQRIRDAFDVEYGNDDQFVFPLMDDEAFRRQRDVVLSIKPHYSEKILSGSKTVELRRRFPVSAPGGVIAYIYETSPTKAMVGTVEIRDVLKMPVEQIWTEFEKRAFIEREKFDQYFEGADHGFALVFNDVKTFSRPLPLHELRERFGFEPPQSFLYAKRDLRKALNDEPAIVSH